MVIQVAGEAFQVVLQKEDAEELRVRALYCDEPRRGNGEVERDPDRPQRAPQQAPVAAQSSERNDDDSRKKNSDGSLNECRQRAEEIKPQPVATPAGIPAIPAESIRPCGRP